LQPEQEMKNQQLPETGTKAFKVHFKDDITAGFLVFLIALPLCLGISLASGFPAVAGLFTAIIGGVIVTFFKGSNVAIKGPAAGLIVIALGAVQELGGGDPFVGYQFALATIVVAGIIQVFFGLFKSGVLGDFFPSAAVQGMLASIGIIIVSGQIHVLLGVQPEAKTPFGLILEIPRSLLNVNPRIGIIGLISLFLLFIIPIFKSNLFKKIPPQLLVLLISVVLGIWFHLDKEHSYVFMNNLEYQVGPQYLVKLPDNILQAITFPDFSKVFSGTSIKYIFLFAIVGSLESLLSAKAVDIVDPWKRKSNLNRDLTGVGAGNILAGLIGGLPMITEIVRSSANINSGAKSLWSNFYHGIFLLVFILFFPQIIHLIPLTALAAMLIFTGFKLASPQHAMNMLKIGFDQLAIFLVTIVVTLATDLLIGIFAGIASNIIIHFMFGLKLKNIFKPIITVYNVNETYTVDVAHSAIFTNWLSFKKKLEMLPRGKKIIIDINETILVDRTVIEHLQNFKADYIAEGGEFEIKEDKINPISNHPLASRRGKKN
jgi:MFS superfamily sulfate permease-like transporter